VPPSVQQPTSPNSSKARPLEQQNAHDHGKRDDRHREARGPAHAAAHPPQQRATHDNWDNDIEWQSAHPVAAQRQPLALPAPMPTAPPICIQVSVPLTLTKRGPYAAQELLPAAPFNGSSLPETMGLSGFRVPDGSANAIEDGSTATTIARRAFRMLPVYRV